MDCIRSRAFLLVIGIAAGLCILFTGLEWTKGGARPCVLEDRINPNTASVASLIRLPGLGPVRAQTLVAYRTRYQGQRGRPAFMDLNDLDAVPGLGPHALQAMAPYLRFDDK